MLSFSTRRSRYFIRLGVRQRMTWRRGRFSYRIEDRPRWLALAALSGRALPGHAGVTTKVLTRTAAMLAPVRLGVNDSRRQSYGIAKPELFLNLIELS